MHRCMSEGVKAVSYKLEISKAIVANHSPLMGLKGFHKRPTDLLSDNLTSHHPRASHGQMLPSLSGTSWGPLGPTWPRSTRCRATCDLNYVGGSIPYT